MEKIFILIFIWHFIFFAEGSCDNFKNDVVLLIATMMIVKYFRKNVFKNKLTRVYAIGVCVASCLHSMFGTSGWILTKLA